MQIIPESAINMNMLTRTAWPDYTAVSVRDGNSLLTFNQHLRQHKLADRTETEALFGSVHVTLCTSVGFAVTYKAKTEQ